MFDVNQVVNELKRRLPQFTDLCSSNSLAIQALSKSGNQITLTIPNHGFNPDLGDYIVTKNIMYKFPISKITKLQDALNGNKRFIIKIDYDNPFEDVLVGQYFRITDVSTDTQYNGSVMLEQYLYQSQELLLHTSNNITTEEIISQGNILFPVYNNQNVKNALNGTHKITQIVDANNIKFTLNDPETNKKEYPINSFDITQASITTPEVVLFPSVELFMDNKIASSMPPHNYTILVINKGSGGSTQGITNASVDVRESNTGGLSDDRNCFFDIFIFSKQMNDINTPGYIKEYGQFEIDKSEILSSIYKVLRTAIFEIPFSFNNGYARPAINIEEGFYDRIGSRIAWIAPWKINYSVMPSDILREGAQTKIKSLDIKNQYNNDTITDINIDY